MDPVPRPAWILALLAAIGAAAFFLLAPSGPHWTNLGTVPVRPLPAPQVALPPTPAPPAAAPIEPAQPVRHWHRQRTWRGEDSGGDFGPLSRAGDGEVQPGPVPPAHEQVRSDGTGPVRIPGSEMDSRSRRAPYHGYTGGDPAPR